MQSLPESDAAASGDDVSSQLPRFRQLLEQNRPADVERETARLLAQHPAHRDLLYLHAVALRAQMKIGPALETLQTLEDFHPGYPRLHQERGYCYVAQRDAPRAIEAFSRAVAMNPALPGSWRTLQSLYRMVGRPEDAETAGQHVATMAALPVEVVTARSMVADGNLAEADELIRQYLQRSPRDVEALRILAMIAQKNDFARDAAILLEAVLKQSPEYHAARHDYVLALMETHRYKEAREQIERLIEAEPKHRPHRVTLASVLVGLGETREAIARFRESIAATPGDPLLHLSLGHALKTQGERAAAEAAYMEAARLRPDFGDAYWSLANLKTYRFSDEQIATMREHVAARRTPHEDRVHLCFALGKALEDRGDFEESFRFYARGNELRRSDSTYHAGALARTLRTQQSVCTAEFFARRHGWGCPDPAPIFIVGLPRAGSTLIEQILSSHSMIEGTMELADVPRLASSLDMHPSGARYPGILEELGEEDFRNFGEAYLRDTRHYRALGRPYFIDKMPNNFRHVSLIHLMLPNAKIIDARREPMACCFSNFKQLFASGQQFTYSLEDIAQYYRLYVEIMDHWDRVLPGRVLRVQHEDVIDDLEGSVRRILDYLGLPFEPACVEFHKTERRVHTASSEQVRRPINREGVDQWRNFELWLGPLREALGPLASG